MNRSSMITKVKQEISDIRIGLLEAATDYIAAITELSQANEEEVSETEPQQKSQPPESDMQ
ncbi:MAG: hypothetical protein KAG53_01610 [Endozoicomonadaceae bacterium]|nr:hypothetical protein [Endozoicomonadaceae bacterium]